MVDSNPPARPHRISSDLITENGRTDAMIDSLSVSVINAEGHAVLATYSVQ